MSNACRVTHMLVAAMLACIVGCSTTGAPAPPHSLSTNLSDAGAPIEHALPISTTDVTSDGRIAKIRGRVSNPYSEPVTGVRYLVKLLSGTGPDARTLTSFRQEANVRIAPGESAMLRLDLESMYFSSASGFSLVAVPKKLGDEDIPPPPGWKE